MASAFNYRVYRWVLTPVPLAGCFALSETLPRPQTGHVAVALPMTLTWPRSRRALSSVDFAVLDALALLPQRQPARNVVKLGGVGQVDQYLRDNGHKSSTDPGETSTQRLKTKGFKFPFQSSESSGKTDEDKIKQTCMWQFKCPKNTHFPEEVVGGGSVVVPHCHLQRLFLQLNGKRGEGEQKKGDRHGRSCACVCPWDTFGCSVCAHLHPGCRKHKTAVARYVCMENSKASTKEGHTVLHHAGETLHWLHLLCCASVFVCAS